MSRFTASKPSKSAITSVEKFTRQLTTLIARYFLKCKGIDPCCLFVVSCFSRQIIDQAIIAQYTTTGGICALPHSTISQPRLACEDVYFTTFLSVCTLCGISLTLFIGKWSQTEPFPCPKTRPMLQLTVPTNGESRGNREQGTGNRKGRLAHP